jgi:hypothetical protein
MSDLNPLILVDANFLIQWAGNGNEATMRARMNRFIQRLGAINGYIVIPTPAIAEYLVRADMEGVALFEELLRLPRTVVGAFDYKAALELRLLDLAERSRGDKKGGVDAPWQRIKVDRQIVAIGRSHRCNLIISSDRGLLANAQRAGILACNVDDLDAVRRHVAVRESRDGWRTKRAGYPKLPNSPINHSRKIAVSS